MTVLPGSSQTSFLTGDIPGLVGTLTWRLVDSLGANVIAPATSSITEGPSGTYRRDYTAPDDEGLYEPIWNDGTDIADTPIIVSASASPVGTGPFISTQDLADYLGRDVTSDPGALIAVDAACDVVRTFAERRFNQTLADTATLDGSGTDALLLPDLPVTSVSQVLVNGGTVTDYVLNGNGILFRGTAGVDPRPVWPMGRQNVTVTYDHGYADQDIPRDVRMVALSLATRIAVQGPAVEESIGTVSVKYAGPPMDLTNTEKAILHKYRPIR